MCSFSDIFFSRSECAVRNTEMAAFFAWQRSVCHFPSLWRKSPASASSTGAHALRWNQALGKSSCTRVGGARCSEIVDIPSWKWRLKEQDAHHSSIPTHRRGVFETNVGQAPNASRCNHFIKQKVKMASRALNSAGHNGNTSGEATFLALVPSARRQRVLLHTGTRPRNPPRTDSALLLISLIQSAFPFIAYFASDPAYPHSLVPSYFSLTFSLLTLSGFVCPQWRVRDFFWWIKDKGVIYVKLSLAYEGSLACTD